MARFRRLLLSFILLICLAVPYGYLSRPAAANQDPDYQTLELFTDVLSIIRKSYVEEVDFTELLYGAIRGMLVTLDPHSSFLTPEMYQEMKDDTHGEFGGLGIEITIKDGILTVVSPIEDTPAFKAGIKAGDQILKVADTPTKDIEIIEAVRLMRGAKGESISLTIWRPSFQKPQVFTIVRDIIQLQSVKSRLLDDGYGYVRLAQFQARTGGDLQEQLQLLKKNNGNELNGLILDLRNNPGGLLDQAVAVSDLFLTEGLIVYTEGREEGSQLRFNAQPQGTEPNYPLVVLINGGSASASEIVAGALHDRDRAVIIGERSFGKGSVQTVIPLGEETGLRLTTARYYTPNGISIQARGITPDILVPPMKVDNGNNGHQMREKDLQNHFQPLTNTQPEILEGTKSLFTDEDRQDYQLMRAFDLLKGLEILQRQKSAA